MRRAGHEVATVVEQNLSAVSDGKLIQICSSEGRSLVTLDLDFANPLRFDPATHNGVAVLRLPAQPEQGDLDLLFETLAGALKRMDLTGQLWIVQSGQVRVFGPE